MFTIRILFITLTTKTEGMREGASEQSSDLKNYTAPGPRPPVLKFLDPPLGVTSSCAVVVYQNMYQKLQKATKL